MFYRLDVSEIAQRGTLAPFSHNPANLQGFSLKKLDLAKIPPLISIKKR